MDVPLTQQLKEVSEIVEDIAEERKQIEALSPQKAPVTPSVPSLSPSLPSTRQKVGNKFSSIFYPSVFISLAAALLVKAISV